MKDYRPPKERNMNIYHPPPGAKAYDSGLKYSSKTEDMNGFEEGMEFLPTMNAKKLEKRGPKRWVLVVAIIFICLVLSLLVGFLVWHFKFRNVRVVKHYNGHLRLPNLHFMDAYENSNSSEFAALAEKVKGALIDIYNNNQDVGPFHTKTGISAFSEGSVIAYYWSEFSVPKYKADALDGAMANIKSLNQMLHKIRKPEIRVDSLVAFPSDPDIVTSSWDNSCRYALHAKEGVITSFSTPGFPNSPYASNARCLWVLRADADSVISLTFTTFEVEPCTQGNDFVKVYDSLSPVEAHSLVKLCGGFNPSYNLTFVSSQNILLVMLITDAKGRYPGFKAEFFQMPKQQKTCGGVLTGASGNFSTPYYPGHYPPRMDCVWTIKVPQDKNVKVHFQEFFLVEPGIPMDSCTKDYVEINKEKYCGMRQSFVVSSKTNEITVRFHSDLSFVDTGFWAKYLSYDSNDPCPGKFTCKTGRCVDKARRCDGWLDCSDGSDEENCNCTEKQFRCHNNRCKPKYWLCDGVNDCGDNSDELQCQCPADNFKCSNGKCILSAQKCNGKDDCGDGSDEGDCGAAVTVPCQEYTYKCRNHLCVNKRNPECDGEQDCIDNSDEANCNCGNRTYSKKSRIVGGQNSDVGEWPWQVSLHAKGLGHVCGATLISEKWLVSAAHCFREENSIRYNDPTLWTAYMGLLDQRDRTNAFVQSRSVKSITQHLYYNDYTFDYDIALVELSSPVTFTKQIQSICLPDATHEFPAGKAMWITGWGATVEDGVGAMILQKAEIRMINQTMCNMLLPNQLTSRMMCVGILTGGVDACQGDSGGPLISFEANNKIFLAGVVSFGDGCARRNKPGVYTRVSKVMDWIKSKTGL